MPFTISLFGNSALRYIAFISVAVFLPALLGCAGNKAALRAPEKKIEPDPLPNRLDLAFVRENHREAYEKFEKAIELLDAFIRERKFFTSGYDARKAELKIKGDRLYFNGEEVELTLGSAVITTAKALSLAMRSGPRASASPGRISFRVYGSGGSGHFKNSLFYDLFKKGRFMQEADALGMARIICHELVHVVQFKRDGTAWYYTVYAANFVINVINPLTYFGKSSGPYLRIAYEVEARKYARAFYFECRGMFERSRERKPDAR